MRRTGVALVGLAAIVASIGVTAAAIPTSRHALVALWLDPSELPAPAEAPSVHYETGAEHDARKVAALLPAALARVEAVQGRPFARPVTIAVYRSMVAYARANGTGSAGAAGVTFLGRLTLSPALFGSEADPLEAVLTHELSHGHLQGWLLPLADARLPAWFKEGLAVMVSCGGGAEGIEQRTARDAIAHGDVIELPEEGSLWQAGLRLKGDQNFDLTRARLAYAEAGMFVSSLRERDPVAFEGLMGDVLDGLNLPDAIIRRYDSPIGVLWSQVAVTGESTLRSPLCALGTKPVQKR